MDEYTPSIEEVRKQYAFAMAGDRIHRTEQYMAEFDRMLAEHDRALSEKVWDEGYNVGGHAASGDYSGIYGGSGEEPTNPYRNEEKK